MSKFFDKKIDENLSDIFTTDSFFFIKSQSHRLVSENQNLLLTDVD